jgi:hypothetical protein
MKGIMRDMVFIAAAAAFCPLILPGISNAQTDKVPLKVLELSNGKYTGFVQTDVNPENNEPLKGFKGVEVSVKNGTEDGKHYVASAEVSIDGKAVFKENDFNGHYVEPLPKYIDYPENTSNILLTVRAKGTWKSTLTVTVTGVYEYDQPEVFIYYMDRDGDGTGGSYSRVSTVPLNPPWVLSTGDANDLDPRVQ